MNLMTPEKTGSVAFRKIDASDEVAYFLQCVFRAASEVLLWQRPRGGNRVLWTAHIISLEKEAKRLELISTSSDFSGDFSPSLPVYFKAETEELLFKTTILNLKKDRIVLKIPSTIQVLEKRNNERVSFQRCAERKSVLIRDSKNREFPAKLLDLSRQGAGFILDRTNAKFFYQDDLITLQSFDGKEAIRGRLVHLGPSDISRGTARFYRMGMKFHSTADTQSFHSFL